jgi:hypothetical protein
MSVRSILAASLIALALPLPAAAKLTRKTVAKIWPGYSALVLDANGVPHIAYQSPDHRPYYAERVGKKFVSELVDDASDAGWDPALGVDAQGHVHMAYHAERMLPSYAPKLVYAFSDGGPWQTEEVDDGGYATSLALDTDDQAHLFYLGAGGALLRYAQQEDVGWELHDTGFGANSFRTTDLALDADGHAHACYTRNGGAFGVDAYYATDAGGDWEETQLGSTGGHLCSLALDADDRPWVAVLTPAAVLLFHHDGMGWVGETVVDFADVLPGFTVGPDGLALALAADGRPFLIVTIFVSDGAGGVELQVFVAHDGEEWLAAPIGSKDEGFDPVLAVAADGTLHGLWRSLGEDSAKLSYFNATFPDLAGSWSGVAVAGGVATGTLTVENQGSDKSKSVPIALYLSDDAVLDGGDTPIVGKFKVGGVAPGESRAVAIEAELAGPVGGQYLIAVVDPDKDLEDLDRGDNTAAALIP